LSHPGAAGEYAVGQALATGADARAGLLCRRDQAQRLAELFPTDLRPDLSQAQRRVTNGQLRYGTDVSVNVRTVWMICCCISVSPSVRASRPMA
jgi:hypothetical protein